MADPTKFLNMEIESGERKADRELIERIAKALEGINEKLASVIATRERSEGGNTKRWSVVRTDNRE